MIRRPGSPCLAARRPSDTRSPTPSSSHRGCPTRAASNSPFRPSNCERAPVSSTRKRGLPSVQAPSESRQWQPWRMWIHSRMRVSGDVSRRPGTSASRRGGQLGQRSLARFSVLIGLPKGERPSFTPRAASVGSMRFDGTVRSNVIAPFADSRGVGAGRWHKGEAT